MAQIIKFPGVKVIPKQDGPPPRFRAIAFHADLTLVDGKEVAFAIEYRGGPVHYKLVVAMLRRAADLMEGRRGK